MDRIVWCLLATAFFTGCSRALASPPPPSTEEAAPPAGAALPLDGGGHDAAGADAAVRSPLLRGGALRSPMPGGYVAGWNGDTGLDIAGDRLDVFAIAAGSLDYSESGHTLWTRGHDTPMSVRLELDEPIAWNGQRITHAYYTHLSKLETIQREGSTIRKHVAAGERLGVSGVGNGVPHLHLGLLLDGEVEQDSWAFILRENDVRKVLGVVKNGIRLPTR